MGEYELCHYGVKGMKWGVKKSEYKSMSKQERKATRKKYMATTEGKVYKATTIGTMLGGPLVGAFAYSIANKKYNSDAARQSVAKGKKIVDDNADKKMSELSIKVESKKVADIKSRITGKQENGKPAFLMSRKEMEDFSASYERRKNELSKQYKDARDDASKRRITEQFDRLENDYLSVVEQDFWYSDD